jgi:N-acetylglutamate synthase-like GNAT family acetyltransferase
LIKRELPLRGALILQLRRAKQSDIPLLQEIEKRARARYLADEVLAFAAEASPIVASRLEQGEVILAEEGGRALGFVLATELDGMLYIANISVEPEFSGRGIGALLIDAADEQAQRQGLSGLALTTFKTPRWNGPWFRRLGFEEMRQELIGPGLGAILDRHRQFLDMTTRETLWRPIRPGDGRSSVERL